MSKATWLTADAAGEAVADGVICKLGFWGTVALDKRRYGGSAVADGVKV